MIAGEVVGTPGRSVDRGFAVASSTFRSAPRAAWDYGSWFGPGSRRGALVLARATGGPVFCISKSSSLRRGHACQNLPVVFSNSSALFGKSSRVTPVASARAASSFITRSKIAPVNAIKVMCPNVVLRFFPWNEPQAPRPRASRYRVRLSLRPRLCRRVFAQVGSAPRNATHRHPLPTCARQRAHLKEEWVGT